MQCFSSDADVFAHPMLFDVMPHVFQCGVSGKHTGERTSTRKGKGTSKKEGVDMLGSTLRLRTT